MFYLIFLSFTLPLNIPFSFATIPPTFQGIFFIISYYFYSSNNHFSHQRWPPGTPPPLVRWRRVNPPTQNALASHWIRGAVDHPAVVDSFRAQRVMVGVYGGVKGAPGCLKNVQTAVRYDLYLCKSRKCPVKAVFVFSWCCSFGHISLPNQLTWGYEWDLGT